MVLVRAKVNRFMAVLRPVVPRVSVRTTAFAGASTVANSHASHANRSPWAFQLSAASTTHAVHDRGVEQLPTWS